jgi:hypothetical protein
MPNVLRNEDILKDENAEKLNKKIPAKNKTNNAVQNTADEIGLNQAKTENNKLEPGTVAGDGE